VKEEKRYYAPRLLVLWKQGRLHQEWYNHDKVTFCELDLSNAKGQCHNGYHFGEWFMVRHFLRKGYEVLPPKYLHRKRPIARQKAIEILGKAGVAFLSRKRKFGSKMRKSPRPDLLVFNSNPRSIFFVEVKRDQDKLSSAQRQFFPMIEEHLGFEVQIVHLMARKNFIGD
jgi:hypothetical protein